MVVVILCELCSGMAADAAWQTTTRIGHADFPFMAETKILQEPTIDSLFDLSDAARFFFSITRLLFLFDDPVLSLLIKRQPSLPLTNPTISASRFNPIIYAIRWYVALYLTALESPRFSLHWGHPPKSREPFFITGFSSFFRSIFWSIWRIKTKAVRISPLRDATITLMNAVARECESDRERWIKVERSNINEQIVCPLFVLFLMCLFLHICFTSFQIRKIWRDFNLLVAGHGLEKKIYILPTPCDR